MNMLEVSARLRAGEAIPVKEQMELVVFLSVPAILEQLVMTLFMSYIDTAMVGGLGYQATAAIGVVASSIWFMNAFVNAAAIGFSVQVAQYLGAGRESDSRDVLCQAILFNVIFGTAFGAVVIGIGQFLPAILGAEAEIAPYARAYFCTVAFFCAFQYGVGHLFQHFPVQRQCGASEHHECGHVRAGCDFQFLSD